MDSDEEDQNLNVSKTFLDPVGEVDENTQPPSPRPITGLPEPIDAPLCGRCRSSMSENSPQPNLLCLVAIPNVKDPLERDREYLNRLENQLDYLKKNLATTKMYMKKVFSEKEEVSKRLKVQKNILLKQEKQKEFLMKMGLQPSKKPIALNLDIPVRKASDKYINERVADSSGPICVDPTVRDSVDARFQSLISDDQSEDNLTENNDIDVHQKGYSSSCPASREYINEKSGESALLVKNNPGNVPELNSFIPPLEQRFDCAVDKKIDVKNATNQKDSSTESKFKSTSNLDEEITHGSLLESTNPIHENVTPDLNWLLVMKDSPPSDDDIEMIEYGRNILSAKNRAKLPGGISTLKGRITEFTTEERKLTSDCLINDVIPSPDKESDACINNEMAQCKSPVHNRSKSQVLSESSRHLTHLKNSTPTDEIDGKAISEEILKDMISNEQDKASKKEDSQGSLQENGACSHYGKNKRSEARSANAPRNVKDDEEDIICPIKQGNNNSKKMGNPKNENSQEKAIDLPSLCNERAEQKRSGRPRSKSSSKQSPKKEKSSVSLTRDDALACSPVGKAERKRSARTRTKPVRSASKLEDFQKSSGEVNSLNGNDEKIVATLSQSKPEVYHVKTIDSYENSQNDLPKDENLACSSNENLERKSRSRNRNIRSPKLKNINEFQDNATALNGDEIIFKEGSSNKMEKSQSSLQENKVSVSYTDGLQERECSRRNLGDGTSLDNETTEDLGNLQKENSHQTSPKNIPSSGKKTSGLNPKDVTTVMSPSPIKLNESTKDILGKVPFTKGNPTKNDVVVSDSYELIPLKKESRINQAVIENIPEEFVFLNVEGSVEEYGVCRKLSKEKTTDRNEIGKKKPIDDPGRKLEDPAKEACNKKNERKENSKMLTKEKIVNPVSVKKSNVKTAHPINEKNPPKIQAIKSDKVSTQSVARGAANKNNSIPKSIYNKTDSRKTQDSQSNLGKQKDLIRNRNENPTKRKYNVKQSVLTSKDKDPSKLKSGTGGMQRNIPWRVGAPNKRDSKDTLKMPVRTKQAALKRREHISRKEEFIKRQRLMKYIEDQNARRNKAANKTKNLKKEVGAQKMASKRNGNAIKEDNKGSTSAVAASKIKGTEDVSSTIQLPQKKEINNQKKKTIKDKIQSKVVKNNIKQEGSSLHQNNLVQVAKNEKNRCTNSNPAVTDSVKLNDSSQFKSEGTSTPLKENSKKNKYHTDQDDEISLEKICRPNDTEKNKGTLNDIQKVVDQSNASKTTLTKPRSIAYEQICGKPQPRKDPSSKRNEEASKMKNPTGLESSQADKKIETSVNQKHLGITSKAEEITRQTVIGNLPKKNVINSQRSIATKNKIRENAERKLGEAAKEPLAELKREKSSGKTATSEVSVSTNSAWTEDGERKLMKSTKDQDHQSMACDSLDPNTADASMMPSLDSGEIRKCKELEIQNKTLKNTIKVERSLKNGVSQREKVFMEHIDNNAKRENERPTEKEEPSKKSESANKTEKPTQQGVRRKIIKEPVGQHAVRSYQKDEPMNSHEKTTVNSNVTIDFVKKNVAILSNLQKQKEVNTNRHSNNSTNAKSSSKSKRALKDVSKCVQSPNTRKDTIHKEESVSNSPAKSKERNTDITEQDRLCQKVLDECQKEIDQRLEAYYETRKCLADDLTLPTNDSINSSHITVSKKIRDRQKTPWPKKACSETENRSPQDLGVSSTSNDSTPSYGDDFEQYTSSTSSSPSPVSKPIFKPSHFALSAAAEYLIQSVNKITDEMEAAKKKKVEIDGGQILSEEEKRLTPKKEIDDGKMTEEERQLVEEIEKYIGIDDDFEECIDRKVPYVPSIDASVPNFSSSGAGTDLQSPHAQSSGNSAMKYSSYSETQQPPTKRLLHKRSQEENLPTVRQQKPVYNYNTRNTILPPVRAERNERPKRSDVRERDRIKFPPIIIGTESKPKPAKLGCEKDLISLPQIISNLNKTSYQPYFRPKPSKDFQASSLQNNGVSMPTQIRNEPKYPLNHGQAIPKIRSSANSSQPGGSNYRNKMRTNTNILPNMIRPQNSRHAAYQPSNRQPNYQIKTSDTYKVPKVLLPKPPKVYQSNRREERPPNKLPTICDLNDILKELDDDN